ncbi:MAG: AAA family ATPase [Alphaproteobacteria bacterium]|nr:AAA family ATPase [Alphaproteobacteria bacterium]
MINQLTITNFRNYMQSRIKTGAAKNIIITGPNGSGKTSVLEAISLLSAGTNLRSAKMDEILNIGIKDKGLGSSGFGVVADLEDETELSVSWNVGDSFRRAMADGDKIPLSDLSKYIRMVWITPREDRLFVEDKSERRTFFDRLVSAFDTNHSGRTARLSKLLSERAAALKIGASNEWLTGIEKQIASASISIAAARVSYVNELNYFLNNDYSISIVGILENQLQNGALASDAEFQYLSYIGAERSLVHDKQTIDGVQKSDFTMLNNALNMDVKMTSTGQQKSALLALTVAHAKLINTKTGARPLILLDEAAAHLDANARKNLFDELASANAQVWSTGIDRELFTDIPDSVFIECENGMVKN